MHHARYTGELRCVCRFRNRGLSVCPFGESRNRGCRFKKAKAVGLYMQLPANFFPQDKYVEIIADEL